jgi:hypothetical protein
VPREGSTRGVIPGDVPQVYVMSTDGGYMELTDDLAIEIEYDADVREVIRQSLEQYVSGEKSDDEWEAGNGSDF